MLKKILKLAAWFMIVAAIASCGTIYTGVDGGNSYQAAAAGPVTMQTCQDSLAQAQQKLTAFSAAQEKTGAIDINALRKMLDEATSAQQASDYSVCQAKSQEVMSYIQRDQNYVQWDKSLSP